MHMHMLQANVVRVGHCDDEEATEKSPIVREDSDRTNTPSSLITSALIVVVP
jgi:hypothetical protein